MTQPSTRTLVTFLLDRTGSMEAIRDDTIGGFNAYLDGLKGNGATDIDFTLIQFDSVSIDKICVASRWPRSRSSRATPTSPALPRR